MYVVSSCLIGIQCKYNGGDNKSEEVIDFLADKNYIAVCPEVMGGLPVPRVPAEIKGSRVINREDRDVTAEFESGAKKALETALAEAQRAGEPIEAAVFQERSPSCGCGQVYDGDFSGRLVEGDGIAARLFKKSGIRVINKHEIFHK
ncbi:MAG: DUF523 domain-containing protein [Firmicutes bacterium]|nr:DUF523 domain-containing protein [Bacillota bacterium]